MNQVYLLTGGNIGEKRKNMEQAEKLLEKYAGEIISRSPLYETEAWGKTDQPPFLNRVIVLRTALSAEELLQVIFTIEKEAGRERKIKYGPRTMDIDILFFNGEVMHTPTLDIPHPAIPDRRFVLVPLNDIAPGYIHPVLHKSVRQLLRECKDPLEVRLSLL